MRRNGHWKALMGMLFVGLIGCASIEETTKSLTYERVERPEPELDVDAYKQEVLYWAEVRCTNQASTYQEHESCRGSDQVKAAAEKKYAELAAMRERRAAAAEAERIAKQAEQDRIESARQEDADRIEQLLDRDDLASFLNKVGREWLVAEGYRSAKVPDAHLVSVELGDVLQVRLSSKRARSLDDMSALSAYACIAANIESQNTFVQAVYFNVSGPGADCDQYFAFAAAKGYFIKTLNGAGGKKE